MGRRLRGVLGGVCLAGAIAPGVAAQEVEHRKVTLESFLAKGNHRYFGAVDPFMPEEQLAKMGAWAVEPAACVSIKADGAFVLCDFSLTRGDRQPMSFEYEHVERMFEEQRQRQQIYTWATMLASPGPMQAQFTKKVMAMGLSAAPPVGILWDKERCASILEGEQEELEGEEAIWRELIPESRQDEYKRLLASTFRMLRTQSKKLTDAHRKELLKLLKRLNKTKFWEPYVDPLRKLMAQHVSGRPTVGLAIANGYRMNVEDALRIRAALGECDVVYAFEGQDDTDWEDRRLFVALPFAQLEPKAFDAEQAPLLKGTWRREKITRGQSSWTEQWTTWSLGTTSSEEHDVDGAIEVLEEALPEGGVPLLRVEVSPKMSWEDFLTVLALLRESGVKKVVLKKIGSR